MGTDKSFTHLITSLKKNDERYFMIPTILFAFMNFSFRCLSKDHFESSVSPKCFCSFTFGTTVYQKVMNDWAIFLTGK